MVSLQKWMMGIKELLYGVFFQSGKISHLDKKLTLPQLLMVCYPNWTSRTKKKATAKLCQDRVGQSFKIPALQKSLSDILGL